MPEEIQFVSGLKPFKKDVRDFKFEKVFGVAMEIPEFFYPPVSIKNQKDTDMCVAFSLTEIAEYLDKEKLAPEWFFAKIKELEGNYLTYGADFKTAGKASVKYGFLPEQFSPHKLPDKDRNYVSNPANWDKDLELLALPFRKKSYFFTATGFQNIISAMYVNKTPVLVGVNWQYEWMYAKDGIVESSGQPIGNHAMKACGWKKMNNKRFLIVQNSYGESVGLKGLFFFSEDIVNKYFKMTPMVLVDMTPEEAKVLTWDMKARIYNAISKILVSLAEAINQLYFKTQSNL